MVFFTEACGIKILQQWWWCKSFEGNPPPPSHSCTPILASWLKESSFKNRLQNDPLDYQVIL